MGPDTPARRRDGATAAAWSWADTVASAAWFGAALLARAPFVARAEGLLDHDQSVVGLMALDIAAGRRFPVFFDGQRYMGAVEAYVASGFVRAMGHSPSAVAMAPLLFFGLFVAGQFAVWRAWRGRADGHLAALLTVLGAPMLLVWGLIPRGGYVEFLAWALPALAAYRNVTRPGRAGLSPAGQAAWGFLLALGYFLNPLSIIVYVTMALDWTFGRHGADLRRERGLSAAWLDAPSAPVVWAAVGLAWLSALAFCCHVDPRGATGGSPYVFLGGLTGTRWGMLVGVLGTLVLLGSAAWWSGAPTRAYRRLTAHPWFLVGVFGAWWPFLAYGALVRFGGVEAAPSLPVWVTAPWRAGPNLRSGLGALGPLVGCDPRAVETVLIGQGVEPPVPRWPVVETGLLGLAPMVVAVALGLVALAAWRERGRLAPWFAIRGEEAASPALLTLGFLAVTAGLYALQGTSPNASSIRYLVPVWVALPGLLALGLRALPRRTASLAGLLLLWPWGVSQWAVWEDIDRPAPARPLASELRQRGVTAIVAPTPVALVVANLTHGDVGALEYQPIWPRLGRRYLDRLRPGRPVTCVTDRRFPWAIRGEGGWSEAQDFGRHLRGLAARHPGSVRMAWEVGAFEVWEVDLPLDEILALEPAPAGPGEPDGLAMSPQRGR